MATVVIPGSRPRLALLVLAALIAIAALGWFGWRHSHFGDPCASANRASLYSRYPALRELGARQQRETERLLARQRAEDITANQQLGTQGEDITPEEALRMSVNQVDEIAALRREHRAEFERECRALAGR